MKNRGEQAEELASSCSQLGVRCRAYKANVAEYGEMESVVKQVIADLGPIAILVNNAGINRDRSFLKMTKVMWDEVMRVNLDGVFHTTQLVAQDMVGAGWGRTINISSIVGPDRQLRSGKLRSNQGGSHLAVHVTAATFEFLLNGGTAVLKGRRFQFGPRRSRS